jgi:glucose/arabinose dehydrogenase
VLKSKFLALQGISSARNIVNFKAKINYMKLSQTIRIISGLATVTIGLGVGVLVALATLPRARAAEGKLTPHPITLANGKKFNLLLPPEFKITVAAQGLKRIRFMAKSPDDRIFVTDMFDLTDNRKGKVYILDNFNAKTGKFGKIIPYLSNLRNPNSVTFHVDQTGKQWLYLALTDRLVRYPYKNGDNRPPETAQTLAKFPDYGLSYKYGGWHLTRTVAIHQEKVYVSVGSSCNACEEKEAVRASIVEMDLDGKNQRSFAQGLRNAVGIKWVNNQLFATNMGADHLGNDQPADTFYQIKAGQHYGWPYCYQSATKVYTDRQFSQSSRRIDCQTVPLANAAFPAHSAPLGLEYFDDRHTSKLAKSFLVALHGASDLRLDRGYQLVQIPAQGAPVVFMSGFRQKGSRTGRPVDILQIGIDSFLLTDDYAGVVYYVTKQ